MTILVKIGERVYEFNNTEDVNKAREIYVSTSLDQNGFEDEMENQHIEFYIDLG